MDYTIPAIPTKYNGVQFRSRLEAKWAAFFDLLNWTWYYEPIDFNGWIPDFALLDVDNNPIYVEVKPVVEFPIETANKIEKSYKGQKIILGCYPFDIKPMTNKYVNKFKLGYVSHYLININEPVTWIETEPFNSQSEYNNYQEYFDKCVNIIYQKNNFHTWDTTYIDNYVDDVYYQEYFSCIKHHDYGDFNYEYEQEGSIMMNYDYCSKNEELKNLWKEACNIVQWQKS